MSGSHSSDDLKGFVSFPGRCSGLYHSTNNRFISDDQKNGSLSNDVVLSFDDIDLKMMISSIESLI